LGGQKRTVTKVTYTHDWRKKSEYTKIKRIVTELTKTKTMEHSYTQKNPNGLIKRIANSGRVGWSGHGEEMQGREKNILLPNKRRGKIQNEGNWGYGGKIYKGNLKFRFRTVLGGKQCEGKKRVQQI